MAKNLRRSHAPPRPESWLDVPRATVFTQLWGYASQRCAKSPPNPPPYRDEHLFVDLRRQAVILDGEAVRLTRGEYRDRS